MNDQTPPSQPGPGAGQPGPGFGGPPPGYGPPQDYQQQPAYGPPPGWQPPKPKSWPMRHKVLSGSLAVVVFIIIAAIAGNSGGNNSPSQANGATGNSATNAPAQPAVQQSTTPAAPQPTTPPAPQYTVAQQQAIDSAESYLTMGDGFSKAGLFSQLHSQYGEGFSARLARFAINHIKVNWFHQAVLSARSYMQDEPGWSYSGLVQQLDSAYGEQFTPAQAEYAARKVGL